MTALARSGAEKRIDGEFRSQQQRTPGLYVHPYRNCLIQYESLQSHPFIG
jgi:hypothetical protein